MNYYYRLRFLKCILPCLLLLICFTSVTWAAPQKQVLIIDLPRFTYEDLTPHFPNLIKLANESSAGIVASRLTGPINPDKLYLNLSSGKQLWSVEEARLILDNKETYNELPAGKVYQSLTGYRAHPNGAVYLGMPKITQLNLKNEPNTNIGMVGKVLHDYGLKTAVIGNADTKEDINRSGAIPWVDQAGLIDLSALGSETVVEDSAFPSGLRSNVDRLFTYWEQFSGKAQVISISLGDLERIEHYRDYMTDSRRKYFRNQALRNYDRFLGKLLASVDPQKTMVVLYSILAPETDDQTQRLNPVLIKAPGQKPGLIIASSTRRLGLLTGSDLIASIFSFLEIKDQKLYPGRSIRTVSGNWPQIATKLNELDFNYRVRWDLLPVHGYALIVIVLAFIAAVIYFPQHGWAFHTLQQFYLFLMTIPAVCLIESFINPVEWLAIIGWTVGLAGIFYLVVRLLSRGNNRKAVVAIAGFTLLLIILDGFQNGFLELQSFWGYSAVSAARFYGVGNEYLGFLLGAYIVVVTFTLDKLTCHRSKVLWGGWLFLAIFLFYPAWGANIGGGITAVLGLGVANFIWLGQPLTKKRISLLLAALVGLLTLIGVVDLFISGRQMSHFGQFISLVSQQGLPAITDMMSRKWQLNQTLIAANGLSYVLIGILITIPLLYRNPPRAIQRWLTAYPDIAKGVLCLAVTSVVAFLTNDSGIVVVATMFIFGIEMFLVAIIKEMTSI